MPDYVDVEIARKTPGLRLVLTAGVPGPWGEAAKALFHVKGIPYTPVRQDGGMPNDALREWTGVDNAPIAVLDDEPPRHAWWDLVALAERLEPRSPLIPAEAGERAWMFGLVNELAGANGLGWSRRLMMFQPILALPAERAGAMRAPVERMAGKYGYSDEAAAAAPQRVRDVLDLLARQLDAQHEQGHEFLLGPRLTALDLYWAAFAALIEPLPEADCAMPAPLRMAYTLPPERLQPGDRRLLEHRDHVLREFVGLPLDF